MFVCPSMCKSGKALGAAFFPTFSCAYLESPKKEGHISVPFHVAPWKGRGGRKSGFKFSPRAAVAQDTGRVGGMNKLNCTPQCEM